MNENNYSKINKVITDTVNENIKKLQDIFPNAVKDGKLDVIALKEELGVFDELKKGDERYTLNWMGKQNAVKEYQKDLIGKTLKYAKGEGVNEDTTQNLYIEGDNLEVLKLLKKNYNREIKMIYIDPPYNTGNDFVYNDDFSMSKEEAEKALGIRDEYNKKLKRNSSEDGRYHSNWLSMMYPRLKIARELLADDGVIFISIDDHEQANLKKLCDEIFGEDNFISMLIWQDKYTTTNDKQGISSQTDYILCYAKFIDNLIINKFPLREEYIEKNYKNPDNDPNGLYMTVQMYKKKNPYSFEVVSHTGKVWNLPWNFTPENFAQLQKENKIFWGSDGNACPRKKVYLKDSQGINPVNLLLGKDVGYSGDGGDEIEELFKNRNIFHYPKNTKLLSMLIKMVSRKNSLILDFFSGSATTAHAIMKLNAEDGGNRKYIMVQLPELTYTIDKNGKEVAQKGSEEAYKAGYKNICEIGKERIRRAGKQIKEENPSKNIDIGFKVFKVDETTLNWEHQNLQGKDLIKNYKADSSDKDKLDFTPNFTDIDVVYEIMLRQEGLPLSAKIEQLTDIGNRTYYIAKSLVICLEENITKEMVEKLSKINPADNFIFRDSAFGCGIKLKDETFALLSKLRDKNSKRQDAYKVEFI